MNGQAADLDCVTNAILTEILGIMGLQQNRLAQWPVRSVFGLPARRLASLLVRFDQDVARNGLAAASDHMLARFVQGYSVDCPCGIPKDGPLLVVSNHPGAYDILILAASLFREDLKTISSDIAVIPHLPSIAPHFIPITDDPHRRMVAFRTALRHLQDSKALLIFPRGDVEIDPAFSPQALQGIDRWSLSLDLFLRKAARTCSVVATVSGIFSSRWFNHPFLRLWNKPEQRQKVAEILQVSEQLVLSKKSRLTPRVSFSPPLIFSEEVGENSSPGWRMDTLIQTARAQLAAIMH
jgi:hypothetical protein